MNMTFTCIICPNGCEIDATVRDGQIETIDGALCPRGKDYVNQELTDPQRNIASSIPVHGGVLPLASVRLTNPIPKNEIFRAMDEIKKLSAQAPVESGTVMLSHILGYDSDVIITKTVERL